MQIEFHLHYDHQAKEEGKGMIHFCICDTRSISLQLNMAATCVYVIINFLCAVCPLLRNGADMPVIKPLSTAYIHTCLIYLDTFASKNERVFLLLITVDIDMRFSNYLWNLYCFCFCLFLNITLEAAKYMLPKYKVQDQVP